MSSYSDAGSRQVGRESILDYDYLRELEFKHRISYINWLRRKIYLIGMSPKDFSEKQSSLVKIPQTQKLLHVNLLNFRSANICDAYSYAATWQIFPCRLPVC